VVQAYKDLIMELEIITTLQLHPNIVTFLGACIVDKQVSSVVVNIKTYYYYV
jgi:hypothetical protein